MSDTIRGYSDCAKCRPRRGPGGPRSQCAGEGWRRTIGPVQIPRGKHPPLHTMRSDARQAKTGIRRSRRGATRARIRRGEAPAPQGGAGGRSTRSLFGVGEFRAACEARRQHGSLRLPHARRPFRVASSWAGSRPVGDAFCHGRSSRGAGECCENLKGSRVRLVGPVRQPSPYWRWGGRRRAKAAHMDGAQTSLPAAGAMETALRVSRGAWK